MLGTARLPSVPFVEDQGLRTRWRDRFLALCREFQVKPAEACVQFSFTVPGVVAVALNTSKPARIADNVASVTAKIPPAFWQKLALIV